MEEKEKPRYRTCVVPMCENTFKNAPNKIFFHIPRDANIREWCKAMGADDGFTLNTYMCCCEDHFNIKEDTENYMKYKIMTLREGKNVRPRLKKGVVPHIFQCQKNKIQSTETKITLKRKSQTSEEESLSECSPNKLSTVNKICVSPSYVHRKTDHSTATLHVKVVDFDDKVDGPNTALSESEQISKPCSINVLQDDKPQKSQYSSEAISVNTYVRPNSIPLYPFTIYSS